VSRHPEELLLSALINTGDVFQAEELGITTGHLHEWAEAYEWLIDYKIKYKTEPSRSAFLAQFKDFSISDHADVEYAVEQVQRSHLKYSVSKMVREASSKLKADEPEDALDFLHSSSMKITQGIDAANSMGNSILDYSESLDYALERATSEKPLGAPFAHTTLQERTLGMNGGDLWIKAARLGQGKTWDLINDSVASLMDGKRVLFYSLEMNKRQMEYRFQTVLGNKCGHKLTNDQIAKGRGLDLLEYKAMLSDISAKVPGELMLNDRRRGRITARTIAAQVNKYAPDLVVIDYLSLMSGASNNKFSQSWENISQIVEEVKEVACQFDVPILTAAQINREGERGSWRPPKAVNLAGSDSLGRDADCVVTMKRFGMGAMVYSLEKNRHGQSGDLWFSRFDPNNGDFREITRTEAEAIKEREGEYEDE
jgi:replicative DNA helicase